MALFHPFFVPKMLIMRCITPLFAPRLGENVLILATILNLNILLINIMLKETFFRLLSDYTNTNSLQEDLWQEIQSQYAHPKRCYHTLQHLENLLVQLLPLKTNILNWNTILFTLCYHDIVYNALKSNNEEKSAKWAEKSLIQIQVPKAMIEACKHQILATKKHQLDADLDTNYFLDADLSILGQDAETYTAYFQNVRKEYSVYPDLIYKPGRRKALQHFLAMDRIYKTEYFWEKLEVQARKNLEMELHFLM
jgi:predicted metal-dependent HD superfamily phosphohydrolase